MSRAVRAGLIVAVVLGACRFDVDPGGAQLSCVDGRCPAGWRCQVDRCVETVTPADGGVIPLHCGDGALDSDEGCDLGTANADDGRCTTRCQWARCGDGLLRVGVERCDPGINPEGCTTGCVDCPGELGLDVAGVCYLGHTNGASAFDGRVRCAGANAHLVTITSAAENDLLAAILPAGEGT
jgi:hypothetical protein